MLVDVARGVLLAAAYFPSRLQIRLCTSAWDATTLESVVAELNTVPVFAIKLVDGNTLYGSDTCAADETQWAQRVDRHAPTRVSLTRVHCSWQRPKHHILPTTRCPSGTRTVDGDLSGVEPRIVTAWTWEYVLASLECLASLERMISVCLANIRTSIRSDLST